MTKNQINKFFQLMERTSSRKRENIRSIFLERMGSEIIEYCQKYYNLTSATDFKSDLVRFVIRYARTNRQAVDFALNVINDKSKKVRESAIAVVAYSLDKDLITFLETKKDLKGNENDIKNAINAIANKNHNLYYPEYDRWHISQDDLNRHLDVEKYNEDIRLYINKYAPELVVPINEILANN